MKSPHSAQIDAPRDAADPIVTIVVPMYNEERYIAGCLDSILSQTYDMTRAEVLVVDGRSTDRSAAIVREYEARDPRIRLLDNPARIQPTALNLGVMNARGRYVLQMDSHCKFHPDYVERIVEAFERTHAGNVVGLFIAHPGADTPTARAIWQVQRSRLGAGASYGLHPGPSRFIGENEHITAGWSFQRSAFDRVGLFDVRLVRNHDNDMSARIHEAGLGVYYHPEIKADYFARSTARTFAHAMYKNGYFLVPMWRLRPGTFAKMHVAPLLFVLVLLIGGLGGFAWPPLWWLGGAALAAHVVVVDIGASVLNASRHGWWMLAYLPWLFLLTHVSYGLGTLAGILRFGLGGVPPPAEGPGSWMPGMPWAPCVATAGR